MSQPGNILSPLLESLDLSGCPARHGMQPSGYLFPLAVLTQVNVYLLVWL